MTQAYMAKLLDVEPRSVRRWESPAAPQQAPQDAWYILEQAIKQQQEVISFALAKVDQIIKDRGELPQRISLSYWSNYDAYDAAHEDGGSWHMANANTRLVAYTLRQRGIDVEWVLDEPTSSMEYTAQSE